MPFLSVRHYTALIALSLSLAPLSLAANRALIIGIGNYPLKQDRLAGIDLDVQHMRAVALRIGYKPDEIKILFDDQATLAGIRAGMKEWLTKDVRPEDHTLFYYSGHGAQIPDQPPYDEADGLDEVFVTYDAQRVAPAKPSDTWLRNALVDDEFDVLLRAIPSQHLTVILDSCFSGGGLKGLRLAGVQKKMLDGQAKPYFPPSGTRRAKSDAPGGLILYKSEDVVYRALLASRENETAGATSSGSLLTNGVYKAVMTSAGNPTLEDILHVSEQLMPDHQHPLLAGRRELWSKGIYLDNVATPRPQPAAPAQVSALFHDLMEYIESAPGHVELSVNQTEQRVGDALVIHFKAPADGYVNIVNAASDSEEAQVLFPNSFHPDNHVREGEEIVIPANGEFRLTASIHGNASVQRNLVVALFSHQQVRYEGDPKKVFATFRKGNTREYDVQAESGIPFAVGYAVTTIRRK